ncbi:putative bifunctional diguanylate cyclase/phosphodiesterase [Actinocrispum wychmicini]|uniref:PAS domain S-box-containing protein/diguanylate cyclase (GGDEF)-like protein n=1 Tax=Actinocrispum wychmicini TaxID=1213861 RepID=A0A4R2JZC3_9PSEU|nr:EAL domain-containing protein [Actinocrispum wychmicini]TCO62649.1 PAS domain S-box-containing protein/diguanylate cyclase (GGDEF)-like protein [Actinocrispum wychmicini]
MPRQEPTSPLPDASHRRGVRERHKLARKWASLISATNYVPLSQDELERQLLDLLDQVVAALRRDPTDADGVAARITERLAKLNCSGAESIRYTVDVLGKSLLSVTELSGVPRLAEKVVELVGAIAARAAELLRSTTFDQQEELRDALLTAVENTHGHQRISEATFDEVASCSSSGIVILNPDGGFVRTNGAFSEIVDYPPEELAALTVFDLVHPAEETYLKESYQALRDGDHLRIRRSLRLVRGDGEISRVTLTATILHDGTDDPDHFVTVVEDSTELTLLQNELSRQALHDVLTGLPNRQFFTTHLEGVLRRADPVTGITLFHLDLDAFSLITGGLGREVGDRLLQSVSERLKTLVSAEKAMVAKFDGDEFLVLVENTAATPDVLAMITRINEELSEPVYIQGHGVAATASIGVVHRPPRGMDAADLLRASDMTLRRAKGNGRRQWELFHPDQHAKDRKAFSLAAEMPGAWESGELAVVYRPIVRLSDRAIVGTEAVLRWDHPEHGVVCGDQCLELADETGLILALGPWLLRTACEHLRWGRDLPLSVNLTASQSSDADLVGEVGRVLKETAVSPQRLWLGMPVDALLAANGEAMDNLRTLAENGVQAVARNFGAVAGDLVCVEDLPLRAVRIARWLVDREPVPGSPVTHALLELPSLVHLSGVEMIVDGVTTQAQSDWWRAAGADLAQGSLFED